MTEHAATTSAEPASSLRPLPIDVVSIQSQVVYGRVGNNVAVPALQAQGLTVAAVPTVVLSNTPHYPTVHGGAVPTAWFEGYLRDLSARGALNQLQAILTGYLGSPEQAQALGCWIGQAIEAQPALHIVVEGLEQALAQGAQAVIVTPRAHNPTGCSLSAARARKLRAVLARYPHVLLIVDDHFSLLAVSEYHDVIPPEARRWALIRSVSKMLGPDLRLAFLASDEQTTQRLRLRLAPGTNWVSHLLQDAVGACLSSPEVAAQIAQAREGYAQRRELLATALAAQGIAVTSPADGLSLWLPLPESSQPVVLALARHGWLVRAGEGFAVQAPAHGLRMTVSTIDETSAQAFASVLGHVLGQR